MSESAWLLLAMTLFAGAASPGPSLALVVRSTLNGGRLAGLRVALAHGFGVWLYALAVVFGVATLLIHIQWAMSLIQIVGAAFLCYLGTLMICGGLEAGAAGQPLQEQQAVSAAPTRYVIDGFLIVFLNPKIMIFFLAVFSQFLTQDQTLGTQIAAATLAGLIDGVWYALVCALVSFGGFGVLLQRYAGPIDVFFGVILWAISLTILAGLVLVEV